MVCLYLSGPASATGQTPILLVHSINASASAFEVAPLYDHYRQTRPTYAVDLPGFGLSDRSDRAYTIRLMTDALLAALAHLRQAILLVLAVAALVQLAKMLVLTVQILVATAAQV